MKQNKWSILSMVITGLGFVVGFVGDAINNKVTEQTIQEQVDKAIKAQKDGGKKK